MLKELKMIEVRHRDLSGWAVFCGDRVSDFFKTKSEADIHMQYLKDAYSSLIEPWEENIRMIRDYSIEQSRAFRNLSKKKGIRRSRTEVRYDKNVAVSIATKNMGA